MDFFVVSCSLCHLVFRQPLGPDPFLFAAVHRRAMSVFLKRQREASRERRGREARVWAEKESAVEGEARRLPRKKLQGNPATERVSHEHHLSQP